MIIVSCNKSEDASGYVEQDKTEKKKILFTSRITVSDCGPQGKFPCRRLVNWCCKLNQTLDKDSWDVLTLKGSLFVKEMMTSTWSGVSSGATIADSVVAIQDCQKSKVTGLMAFLPTDIKQAQSAQQYPVIYSMLSIGGLQNERTVPH